jgi:SAM-dependent MidA family methyltransferase
VSLLPFLVATIREPGPMTVADFMETALYHPELSYYSRAPRRSGRGGDFYTSVDVGPLFGELIAVQLAEMWSVLQDGGAAFFDLVEAGAGNGRLARDILYFLPSLGLADRVQTGHDRDAVQRRLAARTLIMPGGLGSTMKAMVFARDLPNLRLRGTGRLT